MTARIVLDCSYALALALPDESPPASAAKVLAQALIAPHIFAIEVVNATLNTVRRGRIAAADAEPICRVIEGLQIEAQAAPDVGPTYHLRLALAHGLTSYDAMYLDLALTRRCALATCDVALAAAARRVGIEIHS